MQRQRKFYITGLEPAMGKQVNDVIKAFDLGTEGVFVDFCHALTATLLYGITQEKLDRQIAAIKQAYEQVGCREVTVVEVPVVTETAPRREWPGESPKGR